ncbi:hypothetical protein AB0C38_40995 [Amycolatopsis sp. NPDC048633]|uniref:hypothetical protein n=1 Tax=Amycolatopsis sp. NPDC048633 TaxID=3157095 RepID=UPI0033DAD4E3
MPVLWALWGIGVLNVVALGVSLSASLIRERVTGSATPAFITILLTMFAMVTTVVGGFSGLLLVLLTDAGVVLVVGTVVLLVGAALVAAGYLGHRRLSRRVARIGRQLLSREEVLDLLAAGLVRSFSRRDGVLEVTLDPRVARERELWTRRADPRDYLAFVAAADEVLAEGRMLQYDDETGEGPPSTNLRWITLEEAAALLGTGRVRSFSHGSRGRSGDDRTAFRGTPTGIKLTDHGWVRHIAVTPELEAATIPLARAARAIHGTPEFLVDGHRER